jgi:hypothetical protein
MSAIGAVVQTIRNVYSSTNVTTGAWVQLDASLDYTSNYIELFDSSGSALELGIGPSGSEVRVALIPPGGFAVTQKLRFDQGQRLAIRAVDANATTGQLIINLMR